MIRRLEFAGIAFVDALGIYRVTYGVPLKQRRELAHALAQLGDRLNSSRYKTVGDLYDYDREFQAIADFCLRVSGVEPDWINPAMLTEFLLPHRDAEGNPQRPILEQLNFPAPDPDQPPEAGGTYPEAIAALWTHTQDLQKALQAAGYEEGQLPAWDELQAVLAAKNKMTDPEARKEAEAEKVAKSIEEALTSGQWFKGVSAIASPQDSDRLMAEIMGNAK